MIGWVFLAVVLLAVLWWLYQRGDNQYRLQALKRIVVGVPFLLLMFLVGTVFAIYVFAVFFVDVGWQLLTGRPGLTVDGYAQRLWDWRDRNTRWVLVGDGSPQLIP